MEIKLSRINGIAPHVTVKESYNKREKLNGSYRL